MWLVPQAPEPPRIHQEASLAASFQASIRPLVTEPPTNPPVGDGTAPAAPVDPAEAWFDQLVVPVDDARLQVMREPTLIMRQRVIPRTADPTVLMPALEAPGAAAVAADPASAVLSVPPPMRRLPSARAWALAALVAVGGVGAGLWLSTPRDPVVDVVELRDPAPALPRGALAVTERGLPEGEPAEAEATAAAESDAPTDVPNAEPAEATDPAATAEAGAPTPSTAEAADPAPAAAEASAAPTPPPAAEATTAATPSPAETAAPTPSAAAPAASSARAAAAAPAPRAATPREPRATKAKKRTKPSPRPSWKPTPTAAPTLFSGSEL